MTRNITVQSLRSFGKSIVGQRSFWALGVGLALAAALPGCVAHAEGALVADYPAEYVETVPPRIEYYPSVVYRGSPAYLVEGRWYYRTHDRWAVFRDEPVELRDYRVRQSPAYLGPSYRYRQDRRAEQRRFEQRREAERHAELQRESARREQERRRAYFEAQRAREHQRAEQQRRFEQQRDAQHRAEEERRVAEQRGRATRRRDRSHGDQQDSRDQRDRRHYRPD
jgi:hypothetical protein